MAIERRITSVERQGVKFEFGEPTAAGDGYIVAGIEFRQQGLNYINNVINSGANPSYLIITVNPMNDKDKKFIVIPPDVDQVTFVEEEVRKKDDMPELTVA